jgi:hypothetical protein
LIIPIVDPDLFEMNHTFYLYADYIYMVNSDKPFIDAPIPLDYNSARDAGEVLELADRHDLGSCAGRRRGSSPLFPITSGDTNRNTARS